MDRSANCVVVVAVVGAFVAVVVAGVATTVGVGPSGEAAVAVPGALATPAPASGVASVLVLVVDRTTLGDVVIEGISLLTALVALA